MSVNYVVVIVFVALIWKLSRKYVYPQSSPILDLLVAFRKLSTRKILKKAIVLRIPTRSTNRSVSIFEASLS